jgi:MOSC domain-containing protein YiiM
LLIATQAHVTFNGILGDRQRIGGCLIEITKVRTACDQLKKIDP